MLSSGPLQQDYKALSLLARKALNQKNCISKYVFLSRGVPPSVQGRILHVRHVVAAVDQRIRSCSGADLVTIALYLFAFDAAPRAPSPTLGMLGKRHEKARCACQKV